MLNNSPYDLAAAVLCLEEAGAVVTDAYGEPLAARPLLGSGHEFQMSCVAAANSELHTRMLEALERGFAQLTDCQVSCESRRRGYLHPNNRH